MTRCQSRVIVIGPAYFHARIDGTGELKSLCIDADVEYYDAGKWAIELAADGVHFSETGHNMFFEKIRDILHGAENNKTNTKKP